MSEMKEHLDLIQQYLELEQFKADALAHVIKDPQGAAEAICSDEMIGKTIIQCFFDSLATSVLLEDHINWAMSIGVSQMQAQLYQDLKTILGPDFKLIEGSLANQQDLDPSATFHHAGDASLASGDRDKDASLEKLNMKSQM